MSVGDIDGIHVFETFEEEYRKIAILLKEIASNNLSPDEKKERKRDIAALRRRVNPPPPR